MESNVAQISAAEFAAKFQSKREVYRFLSSEVKAYLDNFESMTIWVSFSHSIILIMLLIAPP